MRLVVLDDEVEVGAAAAREVASALQALTVGARVLGVATGSSPAPLYRALTELASNGSFSDLRVCALDEYLGVRADDPRSYHATIDREVVGPLGLDPANVMVPPGMPEDADAAAVEYERSIEAVGGVDVQIVGVGVNGHLGFNEPGSSADSRTRVVELESSTIAANSRFFASAAEVPTRAITQGLATICSARHIVAVITGESKAQALRDMIVGEVSVDCPASMLRTHPNATVFADRAAAYDLARTPRELWDESVVHALAADEAMV